MNLPKGLPLGFGEICVDLWDFRRGGPEVAFLLLLPVPEALLCKGRGEENGRNKIIKSIIPFFFNI